MNCRRVNLLLGVQGQLDRAERRMVDLHLRDCELCRQASNDERRIKALIDQIADRDPSAGFEARLRAIATAPPPPSSGPIGRLATRFGVLLAVAVGGSLLVSLGPWSAPAPGRQGPAGDSAGGARFAAPHGGPDGGPKSVPASRDPATDLIRRRGRVDLVAAAEDPGVPARTASHDSPAGDPGLALRAAFARGATGRAAPRPVEPPESPAPAIPTAAAHSAGGEDPPMSADPPIASGRGGRQPTAPVAASPTAQACAMISAQVFADVAGAGLLADCPGCDGAWTSDDEARAALAGVALPTGLQFTVYDAAGRARAEELVGDHNAHTPLPPMVEVSFGELCGPWPLTVELINVTPDWSVCPATGALVQLLAAPGRSQLRFPLTRGCPNAAPNATPTVTPTVTLQSTPTAKPTALPAGIGDLTPTPLSTDPGPAARSTTNAPAAPSETPSLLIPAATSPPAAASPTVPTGPEPTALAPIRWRPTASPTPTARPTRQRPDPSVPKTLEPPGAPPWPTPTPTSGGEPKPRVEQQP